MKTSTHFPLLIYSLINLNDSSIHISVTQFNSWGRFRFQIRNANFAAMIQGLSMRVPLYDLGSGMGIKAINFN